MPTHKRNPVGVRCVVALRATYQLLVHLLRTNPNGITSVPRSRCSRRPLDRHFSLIPTEAGFLMDQRRELCFISKRCTLFRYSSSPPNANLLGFCRISAHRRFLRRKFTDEVGTRSGLRCASDRTRGGDQVGVAVRDAMLRLEQSRQPFLTCRSFSRRGQLRGLPVVVKISAIDAIALRAWQLSSNWLQPLLGWFTLFLSVTADIRRGHYTDQLFVHEGCPVVCRSLRRQGGNPRPRLEPARHHQRPRGTVEMTLPAKKHVRVL